MYLKKLQQLCQQIITECDCGGGDFGGGVLTTGQVLGPGTPDSSLAAVWPQPTVYDNHKCQCHKGQAGIDHDDIKKGCIPAYPYMWPYVKQKKKIKKKNKKK